VDLFPAERAQTTFLRPGGNNGGEGNLISLNICFNIPLILAFSRREKGKDNSAAS
jgi:hypothetical protein